MSGEGGTQPVWGRDGKTLYFVDLEGRLQSVAVSWASDGTPSFGLPTRAGTPRIGFGHWGTQYDVSADGRNLYVMQPHEAPPTREIQVVIGWRALFD